MCSYARHLGTFRRKASQASAPCTRISLKARYRKWWQQRGYSCANLSAEKQAPESVVSRWFLRTGSMEEVSRLNIGFGFIRSCMKAGKRVLGIVVKLRYNLHMPTRGKRGRSWDKYSSRVVLLLSSLDPLMTASLPETRSIYVELHFDHLSVSVLSLTWSFLSRLLFADRFEGRMQPGASFILMQLAVRCFGVVLPLGSDWSIFSQPLPTLFRVPNLSD